MSRPVVVTLDGFLACPSDAPLALLGADDEPVLPAHGLLILGGQPGVGKTTLAVDAAFHLADGVDWLGLPVARPARVLLIENEGPKEPFRRKLAAKRDEWGGAPSGLAVLSEPWGRLSLADASHGSWLAAFVEDEGIDIVIADPLGGLGVQGVGSPAETREFVGWLRDAGLFQRVAFFVLHHTRHGNAGRATEELSGAWSSHADAVLRVTETGGMRRVVFDKLRWSPPLEPVTVATGTHTRSNQRDDLCASIASHLSLVSPQTSDEIAKATRKRRVTVEAALGADDRFQTVGTPPGRSSRATFWGLAPPLAPRPGTSRDELSSAQALVDASHHPSPLTGGNGDGRWDASTLDTRPSTSEKSA